MQTTIPTDVLDYINSIASLPSDREMLQQKYILTKFAILSTSVIAVDETTTAGTTYMQYGDESIKKWTSNIRYAAAEGTKWADRASATYTAETV